MPSRVGGVNNPFDVYSRNFASAAACASGVRVVNISSVRRCLTNGGGATGRGWVSLAISPSSADAGTL